VSTSQGIAHVAPRFRIGHRALLTAFGVLVAAALITITILALTGTQQSTVASPAKPAQAAAASTPQIRFLGPRQQEAAALNAHSVDGTVATAGAGMRVASYTCRGSAQRCLR
jgi:hypothetical protein